MTVLEEQLRIVQQMIDEERGAIQEQDEAKSALTVAGDPSLSNIVVLRTRRDHDGNEPRQLHAPPNNPDPTRGGLASQYPGASGTLYIPSTEPGPAQRPSATQAPRPSSAWGPEPATISRQDYGPTTFP
ncbi:hypothetical protein MMC26_001518 [Xylographa opegraphella]|nr:hypothetical protein [Xylographa opegraphella]